MDASEFLGLRATHNPVRWYLDVVPGICTDDQFLFGGCGLGAAIAALERTTGRPAGVGDRAVPLVRATRPRSWTST